MKTSIRLLFLLAFLYSCKNYYLTKNKRQDIPINKILETKTNKAIIKTTVDKYSTSRKWYYGTIEIYNQSLDTLSFNFNQSLRAENEVLNADYNLYPVSWATEMFYILPNDRRTWTVAWKNKNLIQNIKNIVIQVDTQFVVGHFQKTVKTN